MTRIRLPSGVLLLACFISCQLLSRAPAQDPLEERQELEKERTQLEEEIRREEAKLESTKQLLAQEYQVLMTKEVRARLAGEMKKLAIAYKDGLVGEQRSETEAAIRRDTNARFREVVGPHLAELLAGDLASNLIDRISQAAEDATEVVTVTVQDAFVEEGFEANFESTIKPLLFKEVNRLTHRLDVVRRRIEDLAREEEARRSGVPPGMIAVPGGSLRVGLDDRDLRSLAKLLGYSGNMETLILQWRSTPANQITLEPFFLDQNEVTCAWWQAFLKENPEGAVPIVWKDGKLPPGWENRPVTGISYNDALRFCRWMGRRMPTELEWEYAARYTESPKKELRYYPWGDVWDHDTIRCNYDGAVNVGPRRTTPPNMPPLLPVGTFPEGRSLLGFNDLVGNAYEMTSSYFTPYKGFKEVEINRRRVSSADFNPDQIVLRGGDCLKRDAIVTTFNRLGLLPSAKSSLVGFRTAVSAVRGKDFFEALEGESDLKLWLVDYEPLPGDMLESRPNAELDLKNPSSYSVLTAGGWDFETDLPSKALFIAAASRKADEFRDMNTLRAVAKGRKDQSVMLGYVHLDVPSLEPPLEPGDYFLRWQNSYLPEPVTPTNGGGEEKKDPQEKEPARKPGKQEKKPDPIPEALIIERRGVVGATSVRLESFLPPVVAAAQPTKLITVPGSDQVEVVFAFPIKYHPGKSFLVTLRFKLAPGQVARFR